MSESPAAFFAFAAAFGYALVGTVVLLHHLRLRREAGHGGRTAVQWHGWKAGPRLAALLLVSAVVGAVLLRLAQSGVPVAGLGATVGIGLALHAAAIVARHRISVTCESLWVGADRAPIQWDDVIDYVETPAGLGFFVCERVGPAGPRLPRSRVDIQVPKAQRERLALVLASCVDARLDHTVRRVAREVAATRTDRDAV